MPARNYSPPAKPSDTATAAITMGSAEIIGLGLLLVVMALVIAVAVRRSLLTRSGGIDLCWRMDLASERAWVFGQARFSDTGLALYRSFSPLPLPTVTLDRGLLQLGDRRLPGGGESDLLPVGSVVVRCSGATADPFELALSRQGLTGLQSWLESVPPRPSRGLRGR